MYKNTKVTIAVKDFNIEQTLECGQCFRFKKIGHMEYLVVAHNKLLRIKQMENKIQLYCELEEYHAVWAHYFDLLKDYCSIKEQLVRKDDYLAEAIAYKPGIRILHQDPWETLISFIISQNKQIPHIKQLIEVLSNTYGDLIECYQGQPYYSFPTPTQMEVACEEDFRQLKLGYRAGYICDAIQKVGMGEVNLELINQMTYEEALRCLMTIKGVGRKVADCILLFAYGRFEVFPIDVWIQRIIQAYYFENKASLKEIITFCSHYFGQYAGLAQQYLFYYARDKKIGKL